MTHSVTDFRGEQVFCPVCANSWWQTKKHFGDTGE